MALFFHRRSLIIGVNPGHKPVLFDAMELLIIHQKAYAPEHLFPGKPDPAMGELVADAVGEGFDVRDGV